MGDFPFAPFDPLGISPTIIGPALPGLGTGELIDKNYAQSANGGCDASGTGAGCIARELEFALPVDPAEVNVGSLTNASSHRNFDNTIGLLATIDNSNTAGVLGSGGPDFSIDQGSPAEDDPENVVTGVEPAIPLAAIGNPTGDVKITVFINGSSRDFLSNQFAGDGLDDGPGDPDGLPAGNPGTVVLGAAPLATLADFTGDQFITVSQSTGLVDGDYSANGMVDAADYTVWFDHRGASDGPADGNGSGPSTRPTTPTGRLVSATRALVLSRPSPNRLPHCSPCWGWQGCWPSGDEFPQFGLVKDWRRTWCAIFSATQRRNSAPVVRHWPGRQVSVWSATGPSLKFRSRKRHALILTIDNTVKNDSTATFDRP